MWIIIKTFLKFFPFKINSLFSIPPSFLSSLHDINSLTTAFKGTLEVILINYFFWRVSCLSPNSVPLICRFNLLCMVLQIHFLVSQKINIFKKLLGWCFGFGWKDCCESDMPLSYNVGLFKIMVSLFKYLFLDRMQEYHAIPVDINISELFYFVEVFFNLVIYGRSSVHSGFNVIL